MKYTKDKKFIGKMFDEISPTYDRLNHLLSGYRDKKWRRSAVETLSSLGNVYSDILDLACGSGDLGREFLRLRPENLYSVDISIEMLKINSEKLKGTVNHPVKSDACNLPFKNDFFDLCGIAFGVRNFEDLQGCLNEINRVLKHSARFVTIEMFKPEKETLTSRTFKLYFEKVLPKVGNMVSKSDYAYDYLFESVNNFETARGYSEILQDCGFKSIKVKNNFLGIVYTVFAEKK